MTVKDITLQMFLNPSLKYLLLLLFVFISLPSKASLLVKNHTSATDTKIIPKIECDVRIDYFEECIKRSLNELSKKITHNDKPRPKRELRYYRGIDCKQRRNFNDRRCIKFSRKEIKINKTFYCQYTDSLNVYTYSTNNTNAYNCGNNKVISEKEYYAIKNKKEEEEVAIKKNKEEEKLNQLQSWYSKGLISKEEYDQKRKELLEEVLIQLESWYKKGLISRAEYDQKRFAINKLESNEKNKAKELVLEEPNNGESSTIEIEDSKSINSSLDKNALKKELKYWKDLFDEELITKEEYDEKRKELLSGASTP